jgi:hypothetical protein
MALLKLIFSNNSISNQLIPFFPKKCGIFLLTYINFLVYRSMKFMHVYIFITTTTTISLQNNSFIPLPLQKKPHKSPCYPFIPSLTTNTRQPQSSSLSLLFGHSGNCHRNQVLQYVTLWKLLVLLNMIHLRLIHNGSGINDFYLFNCWIAFLCMYHRLFIHPLIERHLALY